MTETLQSLIKKPSKLYKKTINRFLALSYDFKMYETEQSKLFEELDINYEEAVSIVKNVLTELPESMLRNTSQHYNLFAGLSLKHNFKNILEIGTHKGYGTALLSSLFPNAVIDSVDLPDDHPVFVSSYERSATNERQKFIAERDALLGKFSNINFLQMDSTMLTLHDKKYDFIWVDGAHGYPHAAVDIANAIRSIENNGIVACDDVWLKIHYSDKLYSSIASYEVIEQFKNAGIIDYSLIYKRLVLPHALPNKRKYIAVLKRV